MIVSRLLRIYDLATFWYLDRSWDLHIEEEETEVERGVCSDEVTPTLSHT